MSEDVKSAEDAEQFLTFTLDSETFATDIFQVREVLEVSNITKVPRTPDFMRGVINLRGGVVPVVDLKALLGIGETTNTVDTCIIILEVKLDNELTTLGALADAVQEVIEITENEMTPPPKIGTRFNPDFIRAMGKRNDEFVIILNFNKVFSTEELNLIQSVESGEASFVTELTDEASDNGV